MRKRSVEERIPITNQNFWHWEESWVMAILMLFFILFGSLTVMNMLLGVLVEAPPWLTGVLSPVLLAVMGRCS